MAASLFHKMASLLFHKMAALLFHKITPTLFYVTRWLALRELFLKILWLAEIACTKGVCIEHGRECLKWLVLNAVCHILEPHLR